MGNIPTELLRTLVAVVDLRSYTRAAQSLGVTQPAVSAQIKRLQGLLGIELFDKSGPGISLTPKGAIVVTYARRMLSINDLILHVTEPGPATQLISIGVPGDFIGRRLPELVATCRRRWPTLRVNIRTGGIEAHLNDIHQGNLDVAIGLSMKAEADARHSWFEDAVWVRGKNTRIGPQGPVPLVSHKENSVYHRAAVETLTQAGRECELVFTAPMTTSLCAAVAAGLGVMVLTRSRVGTTGLTVWEDAPLPKPPKLCWGIYLREGGHREAIEDLADAMATTLQPPRSAAA